MTSASDSRSRWQTALLISGIAFIGLNLRPSLTSLSALAERMASDGLSREFIGSLTTVPLILFGLVGLWAGWIGQRLGFARALGLGLLVLAVGCFLRSASGVSGGGELLWRMVGTVLIGAGIALGNVLLPGLAKSRFPHRLGPITSLYATAMNLGAAAGIAFAVPLALRLEGGWNAALASWGVVALVVLLFWSPQMWPRPLARQPVHPLAGVRRLLRQPRAWQVTAYMGLQSTFFYSIVAWLPSVLQHRGMEEGEAAFWVTGLQLIGCVASIFAPVIAGRQASQSGWIVGCMIFNFLGLLGALVLPLSLAGYAVLLLGIGLNGGFGLALLVIAMRSRTPETAAHLSSMAQACGYLFAAPGPFFVGWLSTHGGWSLAMGFVLALILVALIPSYLAGREGVVDPAE
ncbi:MFS transporter [Roseibacillus ishigakijimensis]|uniref:MFS transporter n=1 Tax=Roseibacillus ishigakijimensis TaxID=454146 RepID=A0A934RQY0_9BACT|nr:MFS transporter [Roseibacillus ishigakijimensis]MBK1835283.1 MFS transporter [Roseibacillus ishigakijimensis]